MLAHPSRRPARALAATACLAAVLAGCGGSGHATPATSSLADRAGGQAAASASGPGQPAVRDPTGAFAGYLWFGRPRAMRGSWKVPAIEARYGPASDRRTGYATFWTDTAHHYAAIELFPVAPGTRSRQRSDSREPNGSCRSPTPAPAGGPGSLPRR